MEKWYCGGGREEGGGRERGAGAAGQPLAASGRRGEVAGARRAHVSVELNRPEAVELRRRPLRVAARYHAIVPGADLDAAREVGVARAGGAHAANL
jgi:hypothetical protein